MYIKQLLIGQNRSVILEQLFNKCGLYFNKICAELLIKVFNIFDTVSILEFQQVIVYCQKSVRRIGEIVETM